MEIGVISINHETASVSMREKCHMTESRQHHFLNELLLGAIIEVSVLNTCGRFEVYYVSTKESFAQATEQVYDAINAFVTRELTVAHSGLDAIKHLFKVTTGMVSAVLGEDQILGQVKEAILFSNASNTSGKILNKIFRDAITFSKRVKTDLKISEVPLSLSYIGIKKAKAFMTFDDETQITMVGLGKMGRLAIQYLLEEPFGKLFICVRNPEKLPDELLTHPQIHIVPFDDRYTYIADSHLVVTSTGAPHSVIRKPFYTRHVKDQLIIDLAVPRDVCNALYEDPMLTIWDVDSLKETSEENKDKRRQLLAHVENWLNDECQLTLKWVESTKVDGLLKGWHLDIDALTQEYVELYKNALSNNDSQPIDVFEKYLQSALKKLIKKPIENLKAIDNPVKREQSVQLLKELFEYEF